MVFGWGEAIGLGGLLFGAGAGAQEAAARRRAEGIQFASDMDRWRYDTATIDQNWNFRLQENANTRTNNETFAQWQDQTALNYYNDQLRIRNFDFRNQMRQYEQSERIYGMQLQFNNQAAAVARESENRRFQEILTGMAFDQQDMLVKMLQEEGQIQASGASGRSAGKVLASAVASYGRNQAILAESLVSAKKETRVARRQIEIEKYGADLNANARRMLAPRLAPTPTAPMPTPRPVILDPPKPIPLPRPRRGASYGGPTGLSIAANAATSLAQIGSNAGWWR